MSNFYFFLSNHQADLPFATCSRRLELRGRVSLQLLEANMILWQVHCLLNLYGLITVEQLGLKLARIVLELLL